MLGIVQTHGKFFLPHKESTNMRMKGLRKKKKRAPKFKKKKNFLSPPRMVSALWFNEHSS
jgi:hypothetical protein